VLAVLSVSPSTPGCGSGSSCSASIFVRSIAIPSQRKAPGRQIPKGDRQVGAPALGTYNYLKTDQAADARPSTSGKDHSLSTRSPPPQLIILAAKHRERVISPSIPLASTGRHNQYLTVFVTDATRFFGCRPISIVAPGGKAPSMTTGPQTHVRPVKIFGRLSQPGYGHLANLRGSRARRRGRSMLKR